MPRRVVSGRSNGHVIAGRKRDPDRMFETPGDRKAEAMSRFAGAAVDETCTPSRYGPHGVARGRPRAAMCTLFAAVNLGIGAVRSSIAKSVGTPERWNVVRWIV